MLKKLSDKHYAIERFGLFVSVLIIALVMSLVSGYTTKLKSDARGLNDISLYQDRYIYSKSGSEGDIVGVYTNDDKSKLFMMLKAKNPEQLTQDANNYNMYMGAKGRGNDLANLPVGSIYVYGDTGYMGVYLDNGVPFEKQVSELIIRNNVEITDTRYDVNVDPDPSFKNFDQAQITFNPGARTIKKLRSLNGDNFDPMRAYHTLVFTPKEKELRAQLDADLRDLYLDFSTIMEYRNRLSLLDINDYSVVMPATPVQIKGDGIKVDEEEKGKSNGNDIKYIFEPEYVFNGGYDFNFRKGSIATGYIDKLKESNETDLEFLLRKRAEAKNNPDDAILKDVEWYLSNGEKLDQYLSDQQGLSSTEQVNAAIRNLENSWSKYIADKKKYQVDDLGALLDLEMEYKGIGDNYTVNTDENVLQFMNY